MKKHFNLVRRIADQTFYRTEKSELLNDNLLEVEQRIEFMKHACSHTAKKLTTATLVSLRKCPELQLGNSLNELLNSVSEKDLNNDLFRTILSDCTKLELNLAQICKEAETNIELGIVQKLNILVDKDMGNISKLKQTLKKSILDMDSAKSRYHAALKNTTANGNNTKADTIKEELEEAETKVEQCRDMLATEMYNMISRECEIAQIIVDYVHMQKKQHEEALRYLNETLPQLDHSILVNPSKPMFTQPLEEHLKLSGKQIAYPIEICVRALCQVGMNEEGLFRVTGGASKVKRLKTCFDAHCITFEDALEYDAHVLAGVLKLYLRELPEPLLTFLLYEAWLDAARVEDGEERLKAISCVVSRLPRPNFDNLRYLIKFLSNLCEFKLSNKMSSQNIAIVVGPNILWSNDERNHTDSIGINMNTASAYSVIVDSLVTHCDYFFPGGNEDVYVTPPPLDKKLVVNGHSRASSADTLLIVTNPTISRSHSNDSIQEVNNSKEHSNSNSPKPIIRKKMKPAPVPPAITTLSSSDNSNGRHQSTADKPSSGPPLVPPPPSPKHHRSTTSHHSNEIVNSGGEKPSSGPPLPRPPSPKLHHRSTTTHQSNEIVNSSGEKSSGDAPGALPSPTSPKLHHHQQRTNTNIHQSNEIVSSKTKTWECGFNDNTLPPPPSSSNKALSTRSNSSTPKPLSSGTSASLDASDSKKTKVESPLSPKNPFEDEEDIEEDSTNPFFQPSTPEESGLPHDNVAELSPGAHKLNAAGPTEQTKHNVENIYATYDRRATKPTPAPRSFSIHVDEPIPANTGHHPYPLKKPDIPEKPSALPARSSCSFRIARPVAIHGDPSVEAKDKKGVSTSLHVDCDKSSKRPKSSSELSLPSSSHNRTLSEGNSIDALAAASSAAAHHRNPPPAISRSCLPVPPLPPTGKPPSTPPAASSSESTNL